jgi:hypothetical protein
MNSPVLTGLVATGAVLVVVLSLGTAYTWRLRTSHRRTWEELISKLVSTNCQDIETVALDAVEPSGERRSDALRRELGRKQIWDLLGGMEGIRRMENNSRVLVEIAAYLERWHPEAADAAEEIRLEARSLDWQTRWLHEAEKNGCLELHFHSYGQNAAISYYAMARKTMALFQESEASLLGDLQRAL